MPEIGAVKANMQLDARQWTQEIGRARRSNVAMSNELRANIAEIRRFQKSIRGGGNISVATQEINRLRERNTELRAEISGTTTAIQRMEREQVKANRATRTAATRASTATRAFRQFRSALAAIGVAAGGAGLVSMVRRFDRFAFNVTSAARSLTDMARVTEVSSRELEVLINALRLAGVDGQQAERFFTTFSRRIGLAARNTGPAADAFRRLGFSVTELRDLDAVELFHRVNDRVRELGITGTELAGIFSELADVRIGGRLLPVLTLSQETWAETLRTSREITTSTDATNRELAATRDEIERINIQLEQETKARFAELHEETLAIKREWGNIQILLTRIGAEILSVGSGGPVVDLQFSLARGLRQARDLYGQFKLAVAQDIVEVPIEIASDVGNALIELRRLTDRPVLLFNAEDLASLMQISGLLRPLLEAGRAQPEESPVGQAVDSQLSYAERIAAARDRLFSRSDAWIARERTIASELDRVRDRFRAVEVGTEDYTNAVQFATIVITELERAYGPLGVEVDDYIDTQHQDELATRRAAEAKRRAAEAARELQRAQREARREYERSITALGGVIGTLGELLGLEGRVATALGRLATLIGNLFGPDGATGNIGETATLLRLFGRQHGGPALAGRPYLVGEAGPELIVPKTTSTVVPNHRLGRFGSVTIDRLEVNGVQDPTLIVAAVRNALRSDLLTDVAAVQSGAVV